MLFSSSLRLRGFRVKAAGFGGLWFRVGPLLGK